MKRRTLLLASLGLAACTHSPRRPAPPPPVSTTGTTTSAPPTTSAPAAPTTMPATPSGTYATAPATTAVAGSGWVMQAVRVGEHDAYDRFVVEAAGGEGRLAYEVSYVDKAVTEGEGNPISLPGAAILRVIVRGLAGDKPNLVTRGLQGLKTTTIADVYVNPQFEGQSMIYLALDRSRPFMLSAMTSPERIVVDIQR